MLLAEKQRISENIYSASESALRSNQLRRRNLKPAIAIAGFFFFLMVANLWVQIAVVKQSNQIKDCQEAIRNLERESIQIRIEMAKLESFERVQTIAQKDLHMRIAGPGDYRCIAAAPSLHRNDPQPYHYMAKTIHQSAPVWGKLASWLEGFRAAMAQSN